MPVADSERAPGVRGVVPETKSIFKYESNRVQTFRRWPESLTHISGQRLARAGFWYTGQNTTVQCFECGGRISDWSAGDIAHTKHRLLFPNCKFVEGYSDDIPLVESTGDSLAQSLYNNHLYTSDDSGNSSDSSPLSSSPPAMTSSSGESSSDELQELDNARNGRSGRNETNGWNRNISAIRQSMRAEENRLKSFSINGQTIWPVPGIRPEDLARAGFYLLQDDKVQCAFCTGTISNWTPGLRPLEEHAKHFPLCPFLMEEDVGNIPLGIDPIRDPLPTVGYDVCGYGNTPQEPLPEIPHCMLNARERTGGPQQSPVGINQLGIQLYSGPKNREMGPLDSRKKSFLDKGWDVTNPVSTDSLAEAGFYYIGHMDAVKCFHCDGGLAEWEPGDEPWIEHAKKFPNCSFVKLNKSQSFINECLRQEQLSKAQDRRSNTGNDDITVCRIVNQWMSSDLVKELREKNIFSVDLIKCSLNSRYYECKTPFESYEQLYSAVKCLADKQITRQSDLNSNENQLFENDQTLSTEQSNREQLPNNPNTSMSSNSTTTATTTIPTTTPAQESNSNRAPQQSPKEKEMNGKNSRLICKICLMAEIEVVFLPCGHQLSCSDCAQRLSDCPVCRQEIRGFVRTFFS